MRSPCSVPPASYLLLATACLCCTQASWNDIIGKATGGLVELSATGWFNSPAPKTESEPGNYFVWCAACSTVEVDVLTGEVEVGVQHNVGVGARCVTGV